MQHPRLHLLKKKKLKLGLSIPPSVNGAAKRIGGKWDKKKRMWTFQPDPNVIREIRRKIPNLKLTQEVNDWLKGIKSVQDRTMDAAEDYRQIDEHLWSFQNGSVRFLLEAKRCILGHEMGLGKTVITISAIKTENLGKILVVCPDHLKWTWGEHFKKWGNFDPKQITILESHRISKGSDIQYNMISGNTTKRAEKLPSLLHRQNGPVIMNYDQMRLHSKILQNFPYDVIIFDEAHRLKNRKAKRTQEMFKIAKNTDFLWFLTGTPIRTCYTDIWTLLHACDPERFGAYWDFVHLYTEALEAFHGGIEILGLRDKEIFNRTLSCYMHRKTKHEVIPDLPEKIFEEINVPLKGDQKQTYYKMEKEFIAEITKKMQDGTEIEDILTAPNTISQITRLRQIALHPHIVSAKGKSGKLDIIEELINDINDQLLVFTWYKSFVPFIESRMEEMGVTYRSITGGVTSQHRKQYEQEFNDDKVQVIIGTIAAMGEGLNLQKSKYSIFTDIDWVRATNKQAEDRIHRGNIKTSPTIIRLLHPNTIDVDIKNSELKKEKITNESMGRVEAIRNMLSRRS